MVLVVFELCRESNACRGEASKLQKRGQVHYDELCLCREDRLESSIRPSARSRIDTCNVYLTRQRAVVT